MFPARNDPRSIAVVAALVAGAIAWIATARFGPGISPDSVVYIWAAKNLEAGHGLTILDGTPLVHWGPLYSVLLAMALRIGVSAEVAARAIGCIGYAAFAGLSALWLHRHVRPAFLWVMAVIAVTLSTAVFDVFTYAWSESLLLVLVALFLIDADRVHEANDRTAMARLALWSALASLARYAGATLAVAGALVLLADTKQSVPRRWLRAAAFFAVSVAPLVFWLVRNVQASGAPFGTRPRSGYSLFEVVGHTLSALGNMLFTPIVPLPARVLLVIAGVLAIAWMWRRMQARYRELLPALALTITYVALLLVWTATVSADRASERYVAPILLPIVAIVYTALGRAFPEGWSHAGAALRRRAQVALLLLAVWLPVPVARTLYHSYRGWHDGIPGYTDRMWGESALARDLAAQPPAGVVYSNAPDAYFYFVEREARLSPRRTYYYTTAEPVEGELEAFADSVHAHVLREDPVYLVWFFASPRAFLRNPAEIGQVCALSAVRTQSDGVLYRVDAR